MDDIAKAADYSKATLYVYFQNKEDIVNTLTLQSMKVLHQHLHEGLLQSAHFFECYKSLCYELTHYARQYPLYFQITLQDINIHIYKPNTSPIFKEIFDVGESINHEIGVFLQKGITDGFIRPDIPLLPTIFYFWSSLTGIIQLVLQKKDYIELSMGMSDEAFLDYNFKTLLQSVLKEGIPNAY